MIKPQELRIGNTVMLNNPKAWSGFKGRHCEVEAIGINMGEHYVQLKVLGKLTGAEECVMPLSQFMEYIEGIPLTPDLLIDYGFHLTFDYGDEKHFGIPNAKHNYGVCLSEHWWQFCKYDNSGSLCLIHDEVHFMYLHHLQNIIFSLTGTNLTKKLKN